MAADWVVKLGGSLAKSPDLRPWLDALADTDAVIVPGGGPFADTVRTLQAHWGFDDLTAHHMAVHGMRQYGRMLMGLQPKLQAASAPEEIARPAGCARVWLPLPEALDAAGVPATWDITSDSLAAWLAARIHAGHLLLVKSVELATGADAPRELNCRQLVNQHWVDPVFEEYGGCGPFRAWLCQSSGHVRLARSLADPAAHFTRIRFSTDA